MTADEIVERCKAIVARGTKPTRPEVESLVKAFYKLDGNGAGGSLHIVLDDYNWERGHIEFCVGYAIEKGDAPGEWLARVLLMLSPSQRRKI